MTVELDHTIVYARDKRASAAFLAGILGLTVSPDLARFVPVQLTNRVCLDYLDATDPAPQHYAFNLDSDTFDAAFQRITAAGLRYHSEPNGDGQGHLYHNHGRRGVYFADPNGHLMELITTDPNTP